MLDFIVYGVLLFLLVQVFRLWRADGDLSLLWYEKFGESPAQLAGKVVWITGASSGIGEALAVELSRVGAKLVLSARRKEELERVKQRCVETGKVADKDVLVVPLDSVAYNTHAECVEQVLAHFSKVDVLVNNSGRSQRSLFSETSLEGNRFLLELNVLGQVSLTNAVLPHMMERGEGQIVVTGSTSGIFVSPGTSAYCGSKFALRGFYGTLRAELHAYNIDVLLVCPGPVESNVVQNAMVGQPDKSYNQDGKLDPTHANDVSAPRCARLFMVGMANRLEEIWISRNPYLINAYLFTYVPFIGNWIMKTMAASKKKKQ
ncbi:dehydrogenase/reductase SDR family member 7-like [Branchiostoma lanceolatum]|uniref:dehydrogenase/reductase SDR family member 7-like n=1 Tax=Branchiostoma lanceolatum TaxID=7740 RepID=UPI0034519FAB